MQRRILFITCLILLTFTGFGQANSYSNSVDSTVLAGKVFSQKKGYIEALQGVQVTVLPGSSSGFTVDDGTFMVAWPGETSWVRFSYPGYSTKEILVKSQDALEIILFPIAQSSSDQPLPGPFGQVSKYKNASYGYVAGEKLDHSSITNFESALQGKLPGFSGKHISGMPGDGGIIRIRGLHSVFAVEQPLVVVDGFPLQNDLIPSLVTPGAIYNPLSVIDISDIESVELYRDGNSLFGFGGNQGIIKVSTRQPDIVNTTINFSVYSGLTFQPEFIPVLNSTQYKTYLLNLLQGSGMKAGEISRENPWISGNPSYYYYYDFDNDTNWQDEIMQTARISKYNVSLQGGDEIARFSVSLGYMNQEGIIINSGYQRYNFRLNSRLQILQSLFMEANLGYSYHDANLVNSSTDFRLNPVNAALLKPPMLAPNLRDNLGNQIALLGDTDSYGFSNPVAIVDKVEAGRFGSDLFAGTRLTYEFSRNLSLSSGLNVNYVSLKENAFIPDYGIADFQDGEIKNIAKEGISKINGLVSETRLHFRNSFLQAHFLNAYAGFRATTYALSYNEGNALNTPTDEFKSLSSVTSIENTLIFGSDKKENRSEIFLNGNYRFQDRFLADVILNLAGTSNAGEQAEAIDLFGGKFGFFPAVHLAWIVSSEKFLKKASWLDLMKLRASISWTGNDFYSSYNRFLYTAKPYGSSSGMVRNYIPNPKLKWETTRQVNAGIDLAIWQERLHMGLDVYQHRTTDLLVFRELPAEGGNSLYFENKGVLNASGIELSIASRLVNKRNLQLTLGVMGAMNRSALELEQDILVTTPVSQMILADGQAPFEFYGLETNGIFTDEASALDASLVNDEGIPYSAGDIHFVDQNEDGLIDETDYVALGSILPTIQGGLFMQLDIWNFCLQVNGDYNYGNSLYNYQRYLLESQSGFSNQSIASLYSWKYEGFDTPVPKASFGDPSKNNAFSDRWIEDGSFFRIQQLTLSYRFPEGRFFQNLSVYLTGNNILTLTNYLGYHPDFSYSTDPALWGTDFGQTPISRSVVLGIKLDL